jgi:methenyltetrahydromethanopterin cyclohydrolase
VKTYEFLTRGEHFFYIKTDAESADIEKAIAFVSSEGEDYANRFLQALRILGFKATQVKIDPVDIFEV